MTDYTNIIITEVIINSVQIFKVIMLVNLIKIKLVLYDDYNLISRYLSLSILWFSSIS